MFTDKFFEVLKHEGVVAIVTWNKDEANVTNTWNSYLHITDDEKILIPVAGLQSTQSDVENGSDIKITLGSRDVEGRDGYQGTGFKIKGTGVFKTSGEEFDYMFAKYPFIRSVLEVTAHESKQLL